MDELMRLAQSSQRRKQSRAAAGSAPSGSASSADHHPSVAVLPYDTVRSGIETHPLVRSYHLKTKKVYNYIVKLLVFMNEDASIRPGPSRAARPPPLRPPLPGTTRSLSSCCAKPTTKTGESFVCSACGAVHSSLIVYGSHYRYFAEDQQNGKENPTHWSRIDDCGSDEIDGELEEELEEMMPNAFHGRATHAHLESARALLRAFRDEFGPVAHRSVAVCAAWIVVENPRICTDSRVGIAVEALPVGRFACGACGEAFHRAVDLRMHGRRCVALGSGA